MDARKKEDVRETVDVVLDKSEELSEQQLKLSEGMRLSADILKAAKEYLDQVAPVRAALNEQLREVRALRMAFDSEMHEVSKHIGKLYDLLTGEKANQAVANGHELAGLLNVLAGPKAESLLLRIAKVFQEVYMAGRGVRWRSRACA